MDALFRNIVGLGTDFDASLAAAVQLTSSTPARALGLERVGGLRQGNDANLVVLDRDFRVRAVMVRGGWRVGD
jgi:N-acetylglucosamine-6-phosphate deacetylase